jgi:hypothetical protein
VYGWLQQNWRFTLLVLLGLFVLYQALTNCSWFGCPAAGPRFNPFSP